MEKVDLTKEELAAVVDRINGLLDIERQNPGLVISRCNGNLKSTRRYLRNRLQDKEKVYHCINFFEEHGGFCNCEILFNVLPDIEQIKRDWEKEHPEDDAQ